ncbi:hypothetical protein GE061_016250 [Apolygus lucorum]|uniref:Uncharacterized protein n=1 Tax=Apolygus lucorum TaxID=248454 RepID=A0A6A4K7J1_APOLU|nr:hypothetical protein GE061_016250 [Apolygus lucorum]
MTQPKEDLALPEYYPLNFELWTLFDYVDPQEKMKIELVHIYGDSTELLSAYFVTSSDLVYGVGRNDFGRLGIGELHPQIIEKPREIEHLSGKRIMSFACGAMHTLALTEYGEVFSWGINLLGQLGHGTIINRDSPGLVLLPEGVKIKAIGAKCSYSVAITTDNVVLHWGDTMFTECSCQNMPIELEFPEPISFRQLACATSHVCLLTSNSKVYLWGTSPGEGHLDGLYPIPPQLITTKEHKNITSIACSLEVTVALNENGRIYVLLSPTPLDILTEAQKTLHVMEIAGTPFPDTPIVFRMGDEGFIRMFPPYDAANSDSYSCTESMRNIQCAFHSMATPQVCRRKVDELDRRVHRLQGRERNIGITLYNVKEHSDLTVQLSDGDVHVHTLILVSFCEHFKSMLLGPWGAHSTNDAKVLDMKRYNPRAFRAFLKYVYTGGLDLMQGEDLIDLFDISKSYLEDELVSMCSKMFAQVIKPNNVATLYRKTADEECEELMRHLVTFTSGCLEQVVLTEGFENLDSHLAKRLVISAVKLAKKIP